MTQPAGGSTRGHHLGAAAAGLVAGTLVLGIGGRLLMTLIQISAGHPSSWSVAGTWQVVSPGLMLGPGAGLLFSVARPRLPRGVAAGGLTFGLAHGLLWVAIYFLRPAGPVELSAAPVLAGVLFGLLLLGFGWALAWLEQRWRPAWGRVRPPAAVRGAVWAVSMGGLLTTGWILASR